MIGKIYKARTPYYDQATHTMLYKARPALVLAKADADNLTRTSYVRTHKQTVVHRANLRDEIGDLKSEYEDLYLTILERREAFSNSITQQAL